MSWLKKIIELNGNEVKLFDSFNASRLGAQRAGRAQPSTINKSSTLSSSLKKSCWFLELLNWRAPPFFPSIVFIHKFMKPINEKKTLVFLWVGWVEWMVNGLACRFHWKVNFSYFSVIGYEFPAQSKLTH